MNRPRVRCALAAVVLAVAGMPFFASPAQAAGPFQVMPADPLPAFNEAKGIPAPQPTIVSVTGNPNFTQALQIDVTGTPTSPGLDGEFSFALGAKTAATIQANDAVLATFWGRRVQPATGTGQATFVLERDGGSFKKSATAALQLGIEWRQFSFPFRIAENYAPGEAHFQLWLGYGPQTLQIAGVSLLDYGQGNPTGWPKVTYAGRESNAPWRAAANQRIDQFRKGNLNVNVVDANGQPVSGAAVSVNMKRSAFNFGTASDPAHLFDDPSVSESATDAANLQNAASDLFNQGSLGNSLKWNHWENQTERDTLTYPALQWFRNSGVRIRGHNLIWPSFGVMPPDLQALAGDPAAMRTRINNHITDEASGTRGLIDEWDVINEPYSEHNVQDILGQGEMDSWFRLARAADPTAKLFLNDYGLVEDNGWQARHLDYVYNTVQGMRARGVPIQGIGLESHFGAHGGLELTPPEDLLPIVDTFAALGLEVAATEFDVATDDLQLQADYTRDFMTMMFSDPNVTGISNFGNWVGNIYNPLVALYNSDWSPKPNALVVEDLLHHQWWTNASGTTGANGAYSVRGFQGDYLVSVTVNGISKQVRVSMPTTAGASVTVIADGIQTLVRDEIDTQIGDGGFESGTRGWVDLGGAQSTTDAHSGGQAVRLTGAAGLSQNAVPLTPGTSYTLSAWGKSSAVGNQCYVGVRGGVTPGQATFQYTLNYLDETAYRQKLLAFTPPGGTSWTQTFVWQNGSVAGSPSCTVDDVTLAPTVGTPPPAPAPPFIQPAMPGGSNIAANTGIEAVNTSGWFCLGTCTLGQVTSPVHSGFKALSVTGRAENWTGAAQGVSIQNGRSYNSSMHVRLKNPGTDTALVSLAVTTSTGKVSFPMGSATVTDTGWTLVSAGNVGVAYSGTLQKAEWWVSTRNGTEDLLVDDVSFAPSAVPPAGQDLLINGSVENGKNNWFCFSPCVAGAVTSPTHSGLQALQATNRTFEWAGPAEGVTVTNGGHYKTSAWIRLAAGAPATTGLIKVKVTMTDGTSVSIPLASGTVSGAGWTQVSADDALVSWTGTPQKAEWWISTTSGAEDLYVDDAAFQPAGSSETAFNPVVPTAACVVSDSAAAAARTPRGGVSRAHPVGPLAAGSTFTAYFGYNNANAFGIPVVLGGANAMSPAPADRGQPVQFLPFQRPRRAAVTAASGQTVSWQVDGQTLTASAASPPCT